MNDTDIYLHRYLEVFGRPMNRKGVEEALLAGGKNPSLARESLARLLTMGKVEVRFEVEQPLYEVANPMRYQ